MGSPSSVCSLSIIYLIDKVARIIAVMRENTDVTRAFIWASARLVEIRITAVIAITAASAPSLKKNKFRLPVLSLDTTITDVIAAGPAGKGMARKIADRVNDHELHNKSGDKVFQHKLFP
jgi:hypothetical protein